MASDADDERSGRVEPPVEVLVVSPPTALWGAQLRLLDYAPALASNGIRLTLGSPPEGDFYDAWVHAGLAYRPIPVPFVIGIRDPETGRRPDLRTLFGTASGVVRGTIGVGRIAADYDVVWSFNLRTHVGVASACRLRRTPVAIEVVDIVRPGSGRRLLQLAGALADATIVNSEATGATLDGRAKHLHVIHPGVDTARFQPAAPDPDVRAELASPGGITVGIVGRIDPMKGIHVLVEAMGLVARDHDVKLVVVGDIGVRPDAYARDLRERATRELGDRVRFVGRRDDMPQVFHALDILVNASDSEPFGRSVLEAQSAGVPVIVNDSGGPREFVTDGRTGLVVEHGDPVDLSRAIAALSVDEDLRSSLGRAGREQAVERFDISTRYARVIQVIRQIATS